MRATYVVVLYLPRRIPAELTAVSTRAKAAETAAIEKGARFLSSIFLPGDEMCWLVYEGRSAEAVSEAVRRAGIDFERVVEAAQLSSEDVLS